MTSFPYFHVGMRLFPAQNFLTLLLVFRLFDNAAVEGLLKVTQFLADRCRRHGRSASRSTGGNSQRCSDRRRNQYLVQLHETHLFLAMVNVVEKYHRPQYP